MEEHHILPRRFGGGDDDKNLVTLCASCHQAVESIYDKRFWTAVGLRPSNGDDTVDEFVTRQLKIDEDAAPVPKSELYRRYEGWCESGDTGPVSQHKFSKALQRLRGVDCERVYVDGDRRRCYTGIRRKLLVE